MTLLELDSVEHDMDGADDDMSPSKGFQKRRSGLERRSAVSFSGAQSDEEHFPDFSG